MLNTSNNSWDRRAVYDGDLCYTIEANSVELKYFRFWLDSNKFGIMHTTEKGIFYKNKIGDLDLKNTI